MAPFDQHPDGDAALRGVGLTAQAWREWFARVAATQHINRDVAGERRRLAVDPPSLWDGPPVIGDRLRDLWQAYAPTSEQRCAWDGQTTSLVRSRPSQQLWLDLRPYHNRLESLSVHLVAYATTVECLVPPTGVVLGVPGTLPDATTFRAAVLRSAERLATSVVMNIPMTRATPQTTRARTMTTAMRYGREKPTRFIRFLLRRHAMIVPFIKR